MAQESMTLYSLKERKERVGRNRWNEAEAQGRIGEFAKPANPMGHLNSEGFGQFMNGLNNASILPYSRTFYC